MKLSTILTRVTTGTSWKYEDALYLWLILSNVVQIKNDKMTDFYKFSIFSSRKYWRQRYWANWDLYKPGGPIFLYIGESVSQSVSQSEIIYDQSKPEIYI